MAKKDKVQNFVPELEEVQEETLFEAEAYGNPQPDAGMETTVMKPVGMGGPVPIVAPKHNTIQLQPIIVPLAVVPYMSQDSDILRTDGTQAGGYDTATDFSKVEAEKAAKAKKKSRKAGARAASFFGFLLSGVVLAIYLLAYFMPEFYVFNFKPFDVIGTVIDWIGGIAPQNMAISLLHIISAGFAGIAVLVNLISFIIGKLPAGFNTVLAFISAATIDAALIYTAVKATNEGATFDVMEYLEYIILAGVATLGFIVSIISLVGLNRTKDPYEDEAKSNNVI